jgi:hypothetical protein
MSPVSINLKQNDFDVIWRDFLSSIVRRGPLRSFDLAHLMLAIFVFPTARVSVFERENAA